MHPLVSVIIPTKDRRILLGEALESLAVQSFPEWEALVVDDGSTDGTREFVSGLSQKDSRILYLSRTGNTPGAPACRNQGLALARGEYVIFLDSDDLLAPDCLRARVEVMRRGAWDFAVFLTQVFVRRPQDDPRLWNRFTTQDDLDRFLAMDMPWHTSGPIWKRGALARMGPWDETCLSGQDWEFHVRALASDLLHTKVSVVDSFWRESRHGTISRNWGSTPHLLNRTDLMIRTGLFLRGKGLLTPGRRRRIAAACHRNALELCPDNRLAVRMWFSAWRHGVITIMEFFTLIVTECLFRASRKLRTSALAMLLPESKIPSTHLGSDD